MAQTGKQFSVFSTSLLVVVNLHLQRRRDTTEYYVKVNVLWLLYRFLHKSDLRPEALYNFGSGIWLAWANDTAAHYAAIRCPGHWTAGPAKQLADIPLPQSGTLNLHSVARKLYYTSPIPLIETYTPFTPSNWLDELARRAGSTSCCMLAGRASSMFARRLLDVCSIV